MLEHDDIVTQQSNCINKFTEYRVMLESIIHLKLSTVRYLKYLQVARPKAIKVMEAQTKLQTNILCWSLSTDTGGNTENK